MVIYKEINHPDYKKFLTIFILGNAAVVLCFCTSVLLYWIAFLIFLCLAVYYYTNISKHIQILNTVCEGIGKKSWSAKAVVSISYFTFGLYGVYWIRKQSKRMEEKAIQYKDSVSGEKAFYCAIIGEIYQFIYGIIVSKWEQEYGTSYWLGEGRLYQVLGLYFVGVLLTSICIYFFLVNLDCLVECNNKGAGTRQENPEPPTPVIQEEPVTIFDYSVYRHYLKFLSGMYEGICFPLENNEFLVLGRESQKSNIVFEDTTVSRQHCQIRYSTVKHRFEVIDHSSVGTYVDGVRLESEKVSFVEAGAQIQLGSSDNIFILQEEKEIL